MNYFINKIQVNHLFHLESLSIPIESQETPHLLITGKNGSGKTVLLNAIAEFLDAIKNDSHLYFTQKRSWMENVLRSLQEAKDASEKYKLKLQYEDVSKQVSRLFGKVELNFENVAELIDAYSHDDFILAFYQADRKVQMQEPTNPTKPAFATQIAIKKTVTDQFLFFLSDLKIQEALARNEGQIEDADNICRWFENFEELLQQIYQDKNLKLKFNYKDYSFLINTAGRSFKFTQMSDGFAAVLDIVADLILKMQTQNSLTRAYLKRGIVLIDEVETHLHLELQKVIMPLLTKIFPNVQFIVTTHSPFVLNSMDNAIAFDLEHKEVIDELTEYSYSALAEGYFRVTSESSYMQMQLEKLEDLLQKEHFSEADKNTIQSLVKDFENIPEPISPQLVGQYQQLKSLYSDRLKEFLV